MRKLLNTAVFFTGVVIGGTVSWIYAKEKYAKLAEEEIESVKKFYSARAQKLAAGAESLSAAAKVCEKPKLVEYAKKIQSEGYTDYSKTIVNEENEIIGEVPYIITPDEFAEIEAYTKVSLSYFADGVLADDNNEVVDDVEEIIGDALKHFGEYEDDAVFVRNDAKRCDYEILFDLRNFSDILQDLAPRY